MTDENMTGPDAEGVDWGDFQAPDGRSNQDVPMPGYDDLTFNARAVSYPEYAALPEAPISINFRPGDKPQITVRAHDGAQFNAVLSDLEANGCIANLAAFMTAVSAQGALGGGLGPVSPVGPPQAPPAASAPPQAQYAPPPQQSPGAPPFGPNVSAPQAPGYQGPPQQQGWGGQQSGSREKPRPAGWAMVDVPYGDKDRFKGLREAWKDQVKGKIQWGGKGVYWLEPSIAPWFAQQGFPVMQ